MLQKGILAPGESSQRVLGRHLLLCRSCTTLVLLATVTLHASCEVLMQSLLSTCIYQFVQLWAPEPAGIFRIRTWESQVAGVVGERVAQVLASVEEQQ